MTRNLNLQNNIERIDENLADSFYADARYNALFLGVVGIGFAVIYLLTRYGVLDEITPALLNISIAVLFLAVTQFFTLFLARRKKGILAHLLSSLFVIIFAILVTSFWEGFVYIAIILALLPILTSVRAGMPNPYKLYLYLLIIAGIIGILTADANPPINRLQTNSVAAIASLSFLGATGLLLFTVTIISRSKRYRSLRNRLRTAFIIIVTIPTLMATFLSTAGTYISNRSQAFRALNTVSTLKVAQIEDVVNGLKSDATAIQLDVPFKRNILNVLVRKELTNDQAATSRAFALLRFTALQKSKAHPYIEIMALNMKGQVEVSTIPENQGISYSDEPFYRQGSTKTFLGFTNEATFGIGNLIFAEPIYDDNATTVRGILVLRADSSLVKNIMGVTTGFEEAETYLLSKDFQPITRTRTPVSTVSTDASLGAVSNKTMEGSGIYKNYAGETVVGDYRWIESLGVIFIAETPLSIVISNTLSSTLGSEVLALLGIVIAIVAVTMSIDSISNPISALVETAKSFAAGSLGARAPVDLKDEIGDLGRAYNQIAEQLQNIIGELEQRVSDRTRELEGQSNRLRVAAEIARDAASSRNLTELLEQAGTLMQERFGFYHTGIFLLDNNNEYAILASSPTNAGKEMIANNHKIRVGEAGAVGRVAATGEPRISSDSGLDTIHFNNPLLPDARSELALPLKVQNKLIGVLDVHSNQLQAFHEDDISTMQLMADQLATAIERTRLFQQVEKNLSDLERAYGNFTRDGWRSLGQGSLLSNTGYRFDNVRIQPISELPALGSKAIQSGNTVVNTEGKRSQGGYTVAIPIKLRGQAIGAVTVKLIEGYTKTTISTIELAIERLAASLESARLYEEARISANREQAISHVTSAISSSTEYEEILRTTVREIGNLLSDTDVAIQILGDPDKQGSDG